MRKTCKSNISARLFAVLACLAILLFPVCARGITNDVVINEFMAVNDTILSNSWGRAYFDWIELYNNTPSLVDLKDWYLTDNAANLRQWQFPATNIAAYGYLLVYASGSNGVFAGQLHANFKLAGGGEYLALTHPNGVTIAYEYAPEFPQQYSDVAYGIAWAGTNTSERYLVAPTPGAANSNAFMVSDVAISVPHGFYSNAFQVVLSNDTSGAQIRYTTNGAEPTETSAPYTGAITISRTTVLRARAFKSGWDSSVINTRTYIFVADVITSSNMNTAITRDAAYAPQMTNALTGLPVISLATGTGDIDWTPELSTSVELIYPDGSGDGFQVNAGVARFGNYINTPIKREYRLYFRSEYGASNLEYPLYKGYENGVEAIEKFNILDLHSGSQDMLWDFPLSGPWVNNTQLETGKLNVHGRHVTLYIDGQYWGLYYLRERWGAAMFAEYFGGEPENYEAIGAQNTMADAGIPYDGDGSAWARVVSLSSSYRQVKPYLDVAQEIDFMLPFFLGNSSSEAEWRAGGPVEAGPGFKFCRREADGYLMLIGSYSQAEGPSSTLGSLFAEGDPDFKVLVYDRVYKSFFHDGVLSTNRCKSRLLDLCAQTDAPFIAEAARWYSIYYQPAPPMWQSNKNNTLNKFDTVLSSLFGQLKSNGWYPSVDAPEFNQYGGLFAGPFSLIISGPGGAAIYYTLDGSDPRQEVTGNAVGTQYAGAITLNRNVVVKARAKNGSTWSALNEAVFTLETPSTLRVTEIMFNPRDSIMGMANSTNYEFIEFQNIGTQTIGLAGIKLTSGVRFDFTEGSVPTLDPGEYVVLVSDLAGFTNRYAYWSDMNIAGEFRGKYFRPKGSLDDGGENIMMVDGAGRIIQAFDYEDDWYPCADGEGFSLAILDPQGSTNNWDGKLGWRYSAYVDGSPGQADPALLYSQGAVVINEALSHQDTEQPGDWIELRNTTASPINIGGWYLSDTELDLRKYRIPTNTIIPANGYVVFDEWSDFGTNSFATGTNGFALSEYGDTIYLSAGSGGALAQPAYRETAEFLVAERDVPFGRYVKSDGTADFTAMSAPTTNAANTYPKMGPVVISEIMYNPTNGQNEFIELANISGATVSLYDPLNPTNAWKVAGVNLTFPTNVAIGTNVVLLVRDTISTSAFRATNNVPSAVQIFSYTGSLDDAGEKISLRKPLEPDELGVAYADVDVVKYNNNAQWPVKADGYGYSLDRVNAMLYGNDPANWTTNAFGGTPGSAAMTPTAPFIFLSPGAVSVSTPEDINASNQTFDVMNFGIGTLVYSMTESSAWLSVSPTNGSSTGPSETRTHTISFSTASLAVGRYSAAITIGSTNAANNLTTLNVSLEVVERDKTPPTIDMVSSTNNGRIRVVFDEAVQAGMGSNGAERTANYSVNNGVSISSATLGGGNRTVTLATASAMSEGINYTLSVSGVADRAPIPNPIVGTLTSVFQCVLNNADPVANAGTNQTTYVHMPVTLNGGGSYDPDSKPFPLQYFWSQISGTAVAIANDNSAAASFTPEEAGNYVFELEVFDGADTGTDTVSVTVLFANTLPYAESFESYYNGFQLTGDNSWYANTPDAATVVTNSYTNTFAGALPISGQHRLALRVDGSVTNIFKGAEPYTNVWFDVMIEGVRRDLEEVLSPDADTQFAAYINSNGQICVWNHRGSSNTWTTLMETHIDSGKWFRLTVEANYARVPKAFRIYTNGVAVTNTGLWFESARTNNSYFSAASFTGSANVDDLVVTDYDPMSGLVMWLMQYYPGTNDYNNAAASDTDEDGMTAEEEYIGGTIPTDGNSILRMVKVERRGGGGYRVYWQSVTDRYYSVYKSTNLLKGWLTTPLTSVCWGVTGGTNIIDDASSTNEAAFYRITAIKP